MGFNRVTARFLTRSLTAFLLVVFMLTGMIQTASHAATPTASAEAVALWNQVKDEYNAVTASEVGEYVGIRTRATERLEAIKVFKENNNNQQPSEQQIQAQLLEFAVKVVGYDKSLPKAKADFDRLMPLLIDSMNATEKTPANLRAKKLDILGGLAYLYRYYDFKIGEERAIDAILFDKTAPANPTVSAYDRVLKIREINGFLTVGVQTTEQYAAKIARYTGYPTVTDFIEAKLAKNLPGKTAQEWLMENSKAVIYDTEKRSLWTKFKEDEIMRDYLLLLLNLSDNSLYVGNSEFSIQFGLTSTYGGAQNPQLKPLLKTTIDNNQRFTDFWMRMTHNPQGMDYKGHVIVNDTWADQQNLSGNINSRWARPYATGADAALLDLFYNMQVRLGAQQVGAVAAGSHINYYLIKALGEEGVSTYAHEMTHIYDGKVWFNEQGRRATMRVEDYARGLFETDDNTQGTTPANPYPPMFNLNLAFTLGDNRIQNRTPERFATREDVHQYANGLMDVINSLDAMEALESLKLPATDKALLFNKVEVKRNTRETWKETWFTYYQDSWKDVFTKLTPAEAEKLTTVDSLVDNQILSAKYLPKGIASSEVEIGVNQYVVIPLFEPIYAGLEPTNEGTGSVMFRRYAYDILSEYGWDEGFIAYLSGKYQNEQAALQGILTRHSGNIRTFKKEMYQRRIEKFDQMKPAAGYATATEMQAAMKAAVAQDLATIKANQGRQGLDPTYGANAVRNLKMRILNSYLNSTDDFRDTIYKEKYKWELPVSAKVTLNEPAAFAAGDFKLKVTPAKNNPADGVTGLPTASIEVPANGETNLETWTFTKPGTYTFTVAQVKKDNTLISYDENEVTVTVVAQAPQSPPVSAMKDTDGAIKLSPTVTYLKNNQPTSKIEFNNLWRTWSKDHTTTPIKVTLTENGQPKTLAEATFQMTVTANAANPSNGVTGVPTGSITAVNGQFVIPTYTFTKPGTYKFVYQQAKGNTPNVTYDLEPLEETIVVTVNPQDPTQLLATSTWSRNGNALTEPPKWENTYRTPEAKYKWNLPVAATVTLTENGTPKDFQTGDFKLVVRPRENNPGNVGNLPTNPVSVPAGGQVNLGAWEITTPGTYHFEILQTDTTNPAYVYDATPVLLEVVAQAPVNSGAGAQPGADGYVTLTATVSYSKNNAPVADIRFENTVKPVEKYRWELPVAATVTFTENGQAKSFQTGDFKLQVTAKDTNPGVAGNLPTGEITVNADGTADLAKWTFAEPGTYVFTVTEVLGNAANTTYDGKPVTVTVHVEKPAVKPADKQAGADGFIVLEPRVEITKDGKVAQEITFANTYMTPAPVETFVDTTETVVIKIETEETADPTLYIGMDVVVQQGIPGEKQLVKRQRYVDGRPVGDPVLVSETTTVEMKPHVIRKGTKPNAGETTVVTVEKVAIETVYETDPTLEIGKEETIDNGTEGQVEVTTVQPTWNGQPQGEPQVTRNTVVEMKPKRIRRGSKAIVLEPGRYVKKGEPAFADPLPEIAITDIPKVVTPTSPAITPTKPQLPNTGVTAGVLLLVAGITALFGLAARGVSRRK